MDKTKAFAIYTLWVLSDSWETGSVERALATAAIHYLGGMYDEVLKALDLVDHMSDQERREAFESMRDHLSESVKIDHQKSLN